MANQRGTFAKRNREMKLKDRAKEKAERRAARKAESPGGTKGPQIAWDEAGGVGANGTTTNVSSGNGTSINPTDDSATAPTAPEQATAGSSDTDR